MANSAINLNRYLATLRATKRWWIPLTILSIVAINMAGFLLPKKYEAQAIVTIQQPKIEMIAGGLGQALTVNDRINSIREEMTSFKFLQRIATQLNLDAGIYPNSPQSEKLIRRMADSIDLRVKEGEHFAVAYRCENPKEAEQTTRAIVDQYIENNNNYYASQTKKNETLIESELTQARARRDQAQEAIKQYKNENINQIPESRDEHLKRLGELRTSLQSNQNQLSALRDSLTLAGQKLGMMEKVSTSETTTEANPELSALKKQKQEIELKLNTLLQDFTEKHWQVKQTRVELKQVESQIKLAETNRTEKITRTPNRSYLALQDMVTRGELDEKKLLSQISTQGKEIETLERFLNNIPQHQAELDPLQNALDHAKERVEFLEKRLDEAKTTGAIELKGLGPSLTVMDPPRTPQVPVSPNRGKIAALSVVLGLGMGAALIYLLTLFDSALRSVEEARRMLQMPVLGVMQRIVTATEEMRLRRRHRRRVFGLSATLMVMAVLIVISFTFYREPIQHSIESVQKYINQLTLW